MEFNVRPLVVKLLKLTHLDRIAHHVYYDYVHGFDTANRSVLDAQERCFQLAVKNDVAEKGDYYEFGIFKGYALWNAQQVAKRMGLSNMRFFGFDSFEGLPEVTGCDDTPTRDFYRGQYCCGYEQVKQSLNRNGVDWKRTELVKGFFDQSLTNETRRTRRMGKVAVALIDCDLYSSSVDVLRFVKNMLMDGSILMFDDWNCFDRDDNRGQRLALQEFLARNPGIRIEPLFDYGTWGQVFMVRLGAGSDTVH